jgi:UDP-N-acetylglucosamine:LPS N-acetylglucosamine transferase
VNTDRALRLAIVGGGTGGHVVPGLHMLGELLGASDLPDLVDLVWFETGRAAEGAALSRLEALVAPLVPERCRLTLEPTSGGAPSLLRLATRAPREVLRARRMLKRHRTDVVFGLGGFTLLHVVLAARSLGIPVVLLEINAVPGRAVAKLTPLATRVLHAWPRTMLPGDKHVLTGPPLGPALTQPISAPTNVWRQRLNMAADAPLLAVIGGSQGALALNTFVRTHAAALRAQGVAIVHQVGPGRLDEAAPAQAGYLALEFVDEMVALLTETTVALTRAGASTLAELAVLGVPAVVVPFAGAGGHQRINAQELGDAIRVVEEPELETGGLALLTERLGPAGREWRAQARTELMARVPRDAARKVAIELTRFAKKK